MEFHSEWPWLEPGGETDRTVSVSDGHRLHLVSGHLRFEGPTQRRLMAPLTVPLQRRTADKPINDATANAPRDL